MLDGQFPRGSRRKGRTRPMSSRLARPSRAAGHPRATMALFLGRPHSPANERAISSSRSGSNAASILTKSSSSRHPRSLRDSSIGTSFATGLPLLAMMTSVPLAAALTSSDSRLFASGIYLHRFVTSSPRIRSLAFLAKLTKANDPGRHAVSRAHHCSRSSDAWQLSGLSRDLPTTAPKCHGTCPHCRAAPNADGIARVASLANPCCRIVFTEEDDRARDPSSSASPTTCGRCGCGPRSWTSDALDWRCDPVVDSDAHAALSSSAA
jgi:hypothetical protein